MARGPELFQDLSPPGDILRRGHIAHGKVQQFVPGIAQETAGFLIHLQQASFQVVDEDGIRGDLEQGPVAVFRVPQFLGAFPDRLFQVVPLPVQRLLRGPEAQHDPELGCQFDSVDGLGD